MKKLLMEKTLATLILVSLMVPTAMAAFSPTFMPDSTYHDGYSYFSEDIGGGNYLFGKVEYAVYDTTMQAADLGLGVDYEGPRFIYAYQVFNSTNSDVALDYFEIQGVDAATIANVDDDISAAESMGSSQSYGVEPSNYFFSDAVTEGIWFFDDMTIAQGETSWFLLIYSDYDYTDGAYTVTAPEGDISVPDDGLGQDISHNGVPEPATLVLLLSGGLLSLRRKK